MSLNFTITETYDPQLSFIEQYGLVQYSQRTANRYREDTQDEGICEMCGGYGSRFRVIVDHCGKPGHGQIRGFLCNSCNTLLGKYERGIWTNYDTTVCPHVHWIYKYPSGKLGKQSITNYENCLWRITQNIEIHSSWVTHINKCRQCFVTMPECKLPILLEAIPVEVAKNGHPTGQITAEYLRRQKIKNGRTK
jgi:hypothetical protein